MMTNTFRLVLLPFLLCSLAFADEPVNLLVNGSFEQTTQGDYKSAKELIEAEGRANGNGHFVDAYDDSAFPGWYTTGGIALQQGGTSKGGTLELGTSGFLKVDAAEGDVFVEMDGNHHNQSVDVVPGQVLLWELKHRGRKGIDTIIVSIGPEGAQEKQGEFASDKTAWETHRGEYTVPKGVEEIIFTITPFKASNGDIDSSHFLDNVKLYAKE
ncbi:MAG: hypothetical protein AAGJ81_15655 [Verrucomicrobiota bacterium]